MLISNFYTIEESDYENHQILCSIKLNPNHEVYKGHFPQQAVVPGVIQLQIAREILENQLGLKLMMDDIVQVKYLVPVLPEENQELNFEINIKETTESVVKTNISIFDSEKTFTKARINFSKKEN